MSAIVIGAIVFCVMSTLIVVAYFILNKPPPDQQPLISDTVARQLIDQQNVLNQGVSYNVVKDAALGSSSFLIEQTVNVSPKNCSAICTSDPNCGGFQMHPDGTTCDILASSNIGGYPFSSPGWSFYQLPKFSPNFTLTSLPNQSQGGNQVGSTITGTDREHCSNYCHSNSACVSFSFGSNGCKLWSAQSQQPEGAPGVTTYTQNPAQVTSSSFS